MAEKQLVWSQNSRLWGISQDPFLGADNQYEHSYNISYRGNIKGIVLWPSTSLRYTATSNVIKLYRDSNNIVRGFADNGDIYKDNALVATNVPAWGFTTAFWVIEFRPWFLALVYNTQVFELNTASNAVTLQFTFTATNNRKRPVIVSDDRLYFWAGNILYYTSSSWGWLLAPLVQYTATWNESIYYLSQYLDQLKMYTFNTTGVQWDTIQYMLHKGVPNVYQYKQIFPQLSVDRGCSDWGNDYFFNEWALIEPRRVGVFSWPSMQYLYYENNNDDRLNFSWWGMEMKAWLVYIPWSSRTVTGWVNKSWIFVFGKMLPQYPSSMNLLYHDPSDDTDILDIEFWWSSVQWVILSRGGWKVYRAYNEWFRKNWQTGFSTLWEIVSKKFYGDTMIYRKKIDNFWIACQIPTWCSIDVYYSMNEWSFQLVQTITPTSLVGRRQRVFTNQMQALTPTFDEEFEICQYKLVLNGTGTETPIVYEFNTFYSLIKN